MKSTALEHEGPKKSFSHRIWARQFVEEMPVHGATTNQVRLAAIDMSAACQKWVKEHLPQARMVFDRFHVMQLAGKAVDEVRKELRKPGRRCESAFGQQQLKLRQDLCARHKGLGARPAAGASRNLNPNSTSCADSSSEQQGGKDTCTT